MSRRAALLAAILGIAAAASTLSVSKALQWSARQSELLDEIAVVERDLGRLEYVIRRADQWQRAGAPGPHVEPPGAALLTWDSIPPVPQREPRAWRMRRALRQQREWLARAKPVMARGRALERHLPEYDSTIPHP